MLCVGHLQQWRNCENASVCHNSQYVITGSLLHQQVVSCFLCLIKKKILICSL